MSGGGEVFAGTKPKWSHQDQDHNIAFNEKNTSLPVKWYTAILAEHTMHLAPVVAEGHPFTSYLKMGEHAGVIARAGSNLCRDFCTKAWAGPASISLLA